MRQTGLRETITNLLTALEPEYLSRYNKAMPQEAAATINKLHQQLLTEEKTCTASDQLMVGFMVYMGVVHPFCRVLVSGLIIEPSLFNGYLIVYFMHSIHILYS